MNQTMIVCQLSSQWREPSAMIHWWGHVFATQGPVPGWRAEAPVAELPQEHDEEAERAFDRRMEARWRMDEEWEDQLQHRNGLPWQWNGPAPPLVHHDPEEELVFWRDSLDYLENSIIEAVISGTRIPTGVIGSPAEGTYRLIFSDSESELEDD